MSRNYHNGGQQPEGLEGLFDEHVDETNLTSYLDHELRPDAAARIRSHLECCAECRRLEAQLARASEVFSSLQRDFDQALPAPPGEWAAFEQRLAGVLAEQSTPRKPSWSVVRNAWRKWYSGAPILPWGLAAVAAGVLVGYLWFHSPANRTLSFNDIVNQVVEKRAALTSTLHPVIYRKLRISVSTAPNLPVTVELWKRTSDGRVKESGASQPVTGTATKPSKQSGSRTVQAANRKGAPDSDSSLLDQLNGIYAANHLDWSEPLSATEFKKWTDLGSPKEERVLRESLPGGGEAYRLIAHAKSPLDSPPHFLSEMQLLVRSSDWHAIGERLTVNAASGVRTYEVAELDYRELGLSEVPASVFAERSAGTVLAGDLPHAALGVQPLSGAALSAEVLKRLDVVDALVKDQVEITHAGKEGLKIEGTLASDRRKTEILAALGSLASNPALKIDLLSPSEARNRPTPAPDRPSQVQSVQVPIESQVSNSYLRDWLAHHRGISESRLDAEAQRFQMEALVLSSDAQLQAQALKHILAVLPAAPADGEAAETWRSLVNRHAESVDHQVQALERHLAPVFRNPSAPRAADPSESQNPEDLEEEADRLIGLITASDHALWQAFSHNPSDIDQGQLTEPKFWLMLDEEDSLAAHLVQQARP